MALHGPALEKRQSLLFRCVDIGAELFAIAATCVRAHEDAKKRPADRTALELADLFCRGARRRVEVLFSNVASNSDVAGYRIARDVLDQRYEWLEQGIVPAETTAPKRAEEPSRAVAS